MHKYLKSTGTALAFTFLGLLLITSCKKDSTGASNGKVEAIAKVDYEWGDQSINRKSFSDIIQYNSAGKIDNIVTGAAGTTVAFTYQGNKISLNTAYSDIYELDNQGRVSLHTSTDIDNGNVIHTERYNYDSNGYLNNIVLSVGGTVYSTIFYQVKNGNYTKYALTNKVDSKVTRQYDFAYSHTKVNTAFALVTPVFSNNTYSTVEKYLNFGKQSVNMISSINYRIINLDNSIKTGTLTVQTNFGTNKNITGFKLLGDAITGMPSDNLSPLPRSANFELANYSPAN